MRAVGLVGRGLCIALMATWAVSSALGVSYQAERELGRRFDLAARRQLPLVTDAEIVGYVNDIGEKIVRRLDDSYFDYQFAVVRDGSVNAFAVPGGYVYINTGLLMQVSSDDELAGVLGHEIAHVHAHHIARQQEATQLMNYATLLGMLLAVAQPAIAPLATAANQAVQLKYRREFEQEADYLGARYLQGSGHDPVAMLDFFKKLADQSRTVPTFAPPYLQSHPLTDERLNHLEAVLKTQQWSAHERSPASFAFLDAQVLARVRTEPPTDVIAAYRRLLEENPGNPMAHYMFGVVCLETGQLGDAKGALEAALAGGILAADRELGRMALRQRDPAKALECLGRHLEREPGDAGAHVEFAKALEASGDTRKAMAEYRRALELVPQLGAAHYAYGIIAGRAGEEGDGFYHLATAARLSGDYEKALNQYARAEQLLPAGDPRAEEVRQKIEDLSDFLKVSASPESGEQKQKR